MDAAASIVGFLGLAGQTIQGCNYLINFFDDAKDAPKRISNILADLKVVQSVVQASRDDLNAQLGEDSATIPQVYEDAVENVKLVVDDLQVFVNRYASRLLPRNDTIAHVAATPNTPTDFVALRKGWQKCNIARKTTQLDGFGQRLSQAKGSLILAAQPCQWNLTLQVLASIRQESDSLQSTILSAGQNLGAGMQGILCETKDISHRARAIEQHTLEHQASIRVVQDFVSSGQATVLDGMNRIETEIHGLEDLHQLPSIIRATVETSIQQTLEKHMNMLERHSNADDKTGNSRERKNLTKSRRPRDVRGRPPEDTAQSRSADANSQAPAGVSGDPLLKLLSLNTRGPKRQWRSTSTYPFWFGTIRICTTCTEQEDKSLNGKKKLPPLTADELQIILHFNTRLFNMGIIVQKGSCIPSAASPLLDCRLRIFQTYEHASSRLGFDSANAPPILQAIYSANYVDFRKVLDSGKASPFDKVQDQWLYNLEEELSLFYCVLAAAFNKDKPLTQSRQHGLLQIGQCLSDVGSILDGGNDCYFALDFDSNFSESLSEVRIAPQNCHEEQPTRSHLFAFVVYDRRHCG